MINSYTFFDSDVNKLNNFVLAFFNRIEFETGDFSTTFFETEFYENLVKRHKGILLKTFKEIYAITRTWKQAKRTALCDSIRASNKIEQVCKGDIKPSKAIDIPNDIQEPLITLFKKLYSDVLFGKFFEPHYGSRKSHYHTFRKHANNEYPICPACGIWPMHTSVDDITDQYDHYLPKDTYPFSSVNFQNLVPICRDCNSIEVKSNDDILLHTGKAFYPFDSKHQPIKFKTKISKNAPDIKDIEWSIDYVCEKGKEDELSAWKAIYKIEKRHKDHVKGSFHSWHKSYWDFFHDKESIADEPDENRRTKTYLRARKSSPFESQSLAEFLVKESKKAMTLAKVTSRY
ncbi:MAG: hypothetical protein JJ909_10485 [Roseivirga sp.]|uniref:hypothetical protein n=1 Tax=Roseivirga sp. TaxID=1964215 RepID=UPI001B01B0FB|nr:hypothetical protein [Roseivirga sp.]MBO6660232.1 hypothetical protein [Roseivirga sp.]MBO6761380.1 hypothetical protein [Roseivirga sp.]MBO6907031.1 hypothetical protein [Roseivirga sp.]